MDLLLNNFWELTITGLAFGAIYALIALGYTLVYGVLRLINFAHSEVFMWGSFAAVWVLLAVGAGKATGLGLVGFLLVGFAGCDGGLGARGPPPRVRGLPPLAQAQLSPADRTHLGHRRLVRPLRARWACATSRSSGSGLDDNLAHYVGRPRESLSLPAPVETKRLFTSSTTTSRTST